MPFHEAVRLALQQIRVQKLKSFFTLLGVMIGVMFLIAVVSIVDGMSKYVEEDFAGRVLGANTFTLRRFPWFGNNVTRGDVAGMAAAAARLPRPTSPSSVRRCPRGRGTPSRARTTSRPPASTRGARQVEAHAVEGDYFAIKKLDLADGRVFSQQEAELGAPGGRDRRRGREATSSRGSIPIGRELRIGGMPYTVIGVIEQQGSLFGQSLDATRVSRRSAPRCIA